MDTTTDQKEKKPRKGRVLFGTILLALAAAGYFFYWQPHHDQPTPRAAPAAPIVPVTTARVKKGSFPVYFEGLGTVQALNTVQVHSRVDGQIETVHFKEGQDVKAGDLLLTIDARPFQAALDQVLAKKQQDYANLQNAQADFERIQQLNTKSYASEQQLTTQRAMVAAQTALSAADQAAIETAKIQLDYTQIRSPIDGKIGFRLVDVGNIVHASDQQPMITIVQFDPINIVFSLPERFTIEVAQAMSKTSLQVSAYTGNSQQLITDRGQLSVIDNRVDVANGTTQFKAAFDNSERKLWPGQSVTARLHVRDITDILLVPDMGVQRNQSGLYAWTIKDGRAYVQKITIAQSGGGQTIVTNGLNEGDVIAIDGVSRLSEGAMVDAKEIKVAENSEQNR